MVVRYGCKLRCRKCQCVRLTTVLLKLPKVHPSCVQKGTIVLNKPFPGSFIGYVQECIAQLLIELGYVIAIMSPRCCVRNNRVQRCPALRLSASFNFVVVLALFMN